MYSILSVPESSSESIRDDLESVRVKERCGDVERVRLKPSINLVSPFSVICGGKEAILVTAMD